MDILKIGNIDTWNKFYQTGSINDYLSFKNEGTDVNAVFDRRVGDKGTKSGGKRQADNRSYQGSRTDQVIRTPRAEH